MRLPTRKMRAEIDALRADVAALRSSGRASRYAKYRGDPVAYAREVLRVEPTPDQVRIAGACLSPPHRVLVRSGHNVGKTFLLGWLSNWWYDTRNPGVVITTAPSFRDVVDLLWTEVRLQRAKAGLSDDFVGPAAPEMRTGPEHYAKGYTANRGESFQGRHRPHMFFGFDEAEGVDAVYWLTTGTMFQPDGTCLWVAILNPTTTTSQAYLEEQAVGPDGSPKWTVVTLSALDHPNVAAGLSNRQRAAAGATPEPLPVPNAVTLEQVEGWLSDLFEPVPAAEHDPDLDVEFPPGSGLWHRPEPDGESRVLGRRPTAGTFGVWSERLWKRACAANLPLEPLKYLPELGCDVARYGHDKTVVVARLGPCVLEYEEHGGWDTTRTALRLAELADRWAAWATARRDRAAAPVRPERVRIKVDDTGVGGGVTDQLRALKLNAVPVNAGEKAVRDDRYPLVRDELWFSTRDLAKAGRLDLSRLSAKRQAALQVQALAPTWAPATGRRRGVESKEKTVKRLKFSPDGMDALNLAYHDPAGWGAARAVEK